VNLGAPERIDGPLAFTNVHVVPMTSPSVLPDHDVVIESGLITRVAPHRDKPIPGHARVLDGGGGYLLPGLADLHVHLTDAGAAPLYLANGVTAVRNMWGTPASLALRDAVARGDLPGPRIITTSPIIDGTGPRGAKAWPGTALLDRGEDALPLARRFVGRGYDQLKGYSFLRLAELRALGKAAQHLGVVLTGHCPAGVSYEEAVAAGMGCFEHLVGIEQGHLKRGFAMPPPSAPGNRIAMVDELTARRLDFAALGRLGDLLAAHDVRCCPTIVVRQGIDAVPEAARELANCELVPPAVRASWERLSAERRQHRAGSPQDWAALGAARTAALLRVIATFHEAGVPLLVGTDAPQPWVFEGYSIHDELRNFVAAGLSCYAALSCATREPARFLGEERTSGTVLPGRRADLVLAGSNPLEGLDTLRRPDAVLANGWLLGAKALADGVDERRRTLRQPVIAPAPPAQPPGDRLVHSGHLVEVAGDSQIAALRFRYWRAPDGSWRVEEDYAEHGGDGWRAQRSTWRLTPALRLVAGECAATSPLGSETLRLGRNGSGWDVRLTAADGEVSVLAASVPALVPGATFAKALWPLLLSRSKRSELRVAAADQLSGDLVQGVTTASRVADRSVPNGRTAWHLETMLPGELGAMDLRLDHRGVPAVIGYSSHLGWRELRAGDERRQDNP
jgi:imidazolonepropionase-like amidohydrolase